MTPEERAAEITRGWGLIRVDRHTLLEMTGSDSPYLVVENGGEWARTLIAAAIRAAVEAERERCAQVAEGWQDTSAGQAILEGIRGVAVPPA